MQPRITYILTDGRPFSQQFSAAAFGTKAAWKLWDEVVARTDVLTALWFVGDRVERTFNPVRVA